MFVLPFELGSLSYWSSLVILMEWVLRLIMLVWIPTRRSPEAAKGWLLLIFFEPIVGLSLYWLIGRPDMPRWRRKRLADLDDALAPIIGRLQKHPNIMHPDLGPELNQIVKLAQNVGRLPILGFNSVEPISAYHESLDRLASDIDSAQHHVHLLYYIFAADESTDRIIAALISASRRSVACRILVDAYGSRSYIRLLRKKLTGTSIEIHEILKTGLLRQLHVRSDLRNHCKIAVIDGRIGFTGSQNLVSSQFKRGIVYEELVVRVTGPVVLELQYVFAGDWYLETEQVLNSPDIFPDPEVAGLTSMQILPSGPTSAPLGIQRLVILMIHNARKRVVMTTPYFIPDEALLHALQTAAMRGVEVQLIVSEVEDQFLVGQAQKSYYEELLDANVQIHLYQTRFLHAKLLTIDDELSLVSSGNMDIRSFVLNAEVALLIYDQQSTCELLLQQHCYLEQSRILTSQQWTQRSYLNRLSQNICRLMSPLL